MQANIKVKLSGLESLYELTKGEIQAFLSISYFKFSQPKNFISQIIVNQGKLYAKSFIVND